MFFFVLPRQHALTHCALFLLLCFTACSRESKTNAEGDASPELAAPPVNTAELWKEFNGSLAFTAVQNQIACGPRPAGSPALQQARELIIASLAASGWSTETQSFPAETPHGQIQMTNLLARFPTHKGQAPDLNAQKVVIASHYDTKKFTTISFVGANDGASSTGALLELARVLALDPALATQVELVFFDGEEAFQQFTETDGLYGSRHYAALLRESGRNTNFKYGILWDMIGDKDLTITLPLDSPKDLTQGVLSSAEALQSRQYFRIFDRPVLDDHVPLNQIARIPTLDIIDFDYTPWHTADDTLEQLNPASLQTIGAVTLHFLCQTLR
ncbi:MAG: glutaminyl-peptide cyclotransferase [Verrucomicrobia bacterium]|nr:MAG: glutaminyl-peptide cyclotransferase [Verrucomicrobiota bacterium]